MTAPTFADYVADRWPEVYKIAGEHLNDSWCIVGADLAYFVTIEPDNLILYDDEEAWLRREEEEG